MVVIIGSKAKCALVDKVKKRGHKVLMIISLLLITLGLYCLDYVTIGGSVYLIV